MSDEQTFAAVGELKAAAALCWAADCVEHLAQQVGDTASEDVAASVRLARKYAQDQVYDSATAHALSDAVRRARKKLRVGLRGVVGAVVGEASEVFQEAIGQHGRDELRPIERTFEPLTNSGPSGYTSRTRELRAELAGLLDAAQALCGVDPVDAARDASTLCRKAVPAEAPWQMQRLTDYQHGPPSPAQSTA
jgi:hypothetical protein